MHDVYAYGVIAPSTLIELADEFPPSGGYSEIRAVQSSLGGEAAGSAYVLARLGVPTKLHGTRLDTDPASARVVELLSEAGVDCSAITMDRDSKAVTEVVFAHGGERTIFGTYGRMLEDQSWDPPLKEAVRESRIVCADPFFHEESEALARWCAELETPLVTVDTPADSTMARLAAVVIISDEFISRTSETSDPRDVVAEYASQTSALVIYTRGGRSLWYGRSSTRPKDFTPFAVDVRDTAGAGDSFRGGVIYAMLNGYEDDQLVRIGSAVAALVSQRPPGVLNSPTPAELETFLGFHS